MSQFSPIQLNPGPVFEIPSSPPPSTTSSTTSNSSSSSSSNTTTTTTTTTLDEDAGATNEEVSGEVFDGYRSRVPFGIPHPGNICESIIMSSVQLPPLSYPRDALEKQISEGNLQLAQKISITSENLLSSVIGKWVNQL